MNDKFEELKEAAKIPGVIIGTILAVLVLSFGFSFLSLFLVAFGAILEALLPTYIVAFIMALLIGQLGKIVLNFLFNRFIPLKDKQGIIVTIILGCFLTVSLSGYLYNKKQDEIYDTFKTTKAKITQFELPHYFLIFDDSHKIHHRTTTTGYVLSTAEPKKERQQ